MSLRFALLALLSVDAMTGYDLHKRFDSSVGHVWYAPDSQIYPELRKMEAAGLIEGEEQVRGERGTRRVYHVTDAGDRAFLEWMRAPLDYSRVRDPAHLRAAYLEATTPDAARAFLRAHIAQWEAELEQWEGELRRIDAIENPMLIRRLAATSPEGHARTIAFKRFAYEGLVERARGEIEWGRRGLELVHDLEASGEAWAGDGDIASPAPGNA